MIRVHAYLNFNGQCEEAFLFYEKVFKVENIGIHRFKDLPKDPNFQIEEADGNKVMHTALVINENTMLMGSDCIESFGHKAVGGNNAYIMLDTDTAERAKELYNDLTVGNSTIEMELGEQPWAELYGSFKDQFDICWMIHFEGNKKM